MSERASAGHRCSIGWSVDDEIGTTTVDAVMKGIWPKEFLVEVEREVGYKGLTADPPGIFNLLVK